MAPFKFRSSTEKGDKMNTVENGNTVSVHYTGTLNDGTQFDSSREREPLSFLVGDGQVIPGFESAVLGMHEGETKTITILAENAYGPKNDQAVQVVERSRFPNGFEGNVGESVTGQTGEGQAFRATIVSVEENTVTLDFNHPLAGQDLTFEVELVSIL